MSSRLVFGLFLTIALAIWPVYRSQAITPVAARDYGLQVTHSELSRLQVEPGAHGLQLELIIANQGTHDLADLRLYVLRVGSKTIAERRDPARVRKLSVGEQKTITFVFDTKEPIAGRVGQVIFRVEAVDVATKNIVTFSQKSLEVR